MIRSVSPQPSESDGDHAAFRFSDRQPALLLFSIRPVEKNWAVEDLNCFVEVDAMFTSVARSLSRVPFDRPDTVKQTSIIVFRLSESPPKRAPDTLRIVRGSL